MAGFTLYYAAELEVADSYAKVAELVDALALGASGATRESSSLSFRTRFPGMNISLIFKIKLDVSGDASGDDRTQLG